MKNLLMATMLVVTALGEQGSQASDAPSIHGMLVFGARTIYLSHLPMFHSPHDYQVIVEAELESAARAALYNDRQANPGQALYTLVPSEPFVLPELISKLGAFHATLFRGHFERGGTPIAENIGVKVKRIIYLNRFEPGAAKPGALTELLFGRPGEMFLAHLIVAAPDFDQVVEVSLDWWPTRGWPEGRPFVWVQVPGHDDVTPLSGSDGPFQIPAYGSRRPVTIMPLRQLYLEFDDLSQVSRAMLAPVK